MAACQRALEEYDTLLAVSSFQSPTWAATQRLFDVSRVANMLLAAGSGGAAVPGATEGALLSPLFLLLPCVP